MTNFAEKYCRRLLLVAALVAIGQSATAGDRFGSGGKRTSFGFFAGASSVTGKIQGVGTFGFPVELGADSLYRNLHSFGFEYAEHMGKVALATGLSYTAADATDALKRSLGLPEDSALSVGYLDLPVTYRVSLRSIRNDEWNVSVGVSLVAMFDFVNSTLDIFQTSGAAGDGGFTDKHIDFGIGFGAELAARQRVSGDWYIALRAGARTPISGVSRAPSGFLQIGALWLEP